jgi:hypothetical protein
MAPGKMHLTRAAAGAVCSLPQVPLPSPRGVAWLKEAAAGEKPVRRVQDGAEQRRRKQRTERQRNRREARNGRSAEPDRDSPKRIFDNEGMRYIQFILFNQNASGGTPVLGTC